MSEKVYTQEAVAARFQQFLEANGLRQTKERYAILHAAYELEGTFTIEDLQQTLLMQRFRVSTATLYNTTQLLVQANLLIRHPFSSSTSVFERITDNKTKSYQICNNCHRITHIKSKELAAAVDSYHPRRFEISHRILYVYGTCPKCGAAMRKVLKQTHNTI
ncbi:MAG: transcriptional repressor [Bacteroidaceae bacterium]|nr:transcriptional repressor [Bacteroidaceae bacterium]